MNDSFIAVIGDVAGWLAADGKRLSAKAIIDFCEMTTEGRMNLLSAATSQKKRCKP